MAVHRFRVISAYGFSMDERERYTLAITCADCGQIGMAAWEKNTEANRQHGIQRELILLSRGFHRGQEAAQARDAAIVCDRCDATVVAQPRFPETT
jgi:hypothetical protein